AAEYPAIAKHNATTSREVAAEAKKGGFITPGGPEGRALFRFTSYSLDECSGREVRVAYRGPDGRIRKISGRLDAERNAGFFHVGGHRIGQAQVHAVYVQDVSFDVRKRFAALRRSGWRAPTRKPFGVHYGNRQAAYLNADKNLGRFELVRGFVEKASKGEK